MADGSLAQFKATLARKMARKEKAQGKFDRKKMGFKNSGEKEEFDFPKLSESELEKVKSEIREKFKVERRNNLILLGLIVIIAIGILLYII
ncbi:hypothetical protein [Robertkochia flava]|uniref:hypothetical protein n=1 Tax=Robertkochia flava TaxID=3447986 RepID=UPI001CCB29B6|nr:hypothetical protein [Robertkochia marina]